MIRNLKIKYKILLLPLFATITFLAVLIVLQIYNKENETKLTQLQSSYYPTLELSWELDNVLTVTQRIMQDALSAKDLELLEKADELKNYFLDRIGEQKKSAEIDRTRLEQLAEDFLSYYNLARTSTVLLINGETGDQLVKILDRKTQKYESINETLTKNKVNDNEQVRAAFKQLRENHANANQALNFMTIVGIFVLCGASLIFARKFTKPLEEIVDVTQKFADGQDEVSIEVRSQDEIGILGNSINDMMVRINDSRQEIENQNWLKTGLTELNDRMRGELDITTMSREVLNYLGEFLKIAIGAIYLNSDSEKMKMIGSYAFTRRKGLYTEFKIGEGLVGQAALEKKSIIISEVPDDYFVINSGLGKSYPNNILVTPLIYEDELKGILELGTFKDFSDTELVFIEQAMENFAVSLHSAQARKRVKELLKKTQRQAADLREQQEELRQTNEELEEQTESLKEFQVKLESQQEELKQNNEELEKQAQILEEQRNDIESKNKELLRAQQEIKKKAEDLETTSKYKSEFLANMSHELRTPLNSMLILANLLSENKENNLSDKQIEFTKTIHTSGSDLLKLINDILDLSKVEAGKLDVFIEDVEIQSLGDSLQRNFSYLAKEKNLEFEIEYEPGIPEQIETDRQRLEQVIKNLLSNAFKFTDKGGVKLCFNSGSDVEIDYGDKKTREPVIAISVVDTGIGISEEKQALIFEAFQQIDGSTRRKYHGTGLGLSISRELTWLLKGAIRLQSTKGKGSTFTILLPVTYSKDGKVKHQTNVQNVRQVKSMRTVQEITKKNGGHEGESSSIESIERPRIDDRDDILSTDRTILIIEDDLKFAHILLELTHDKGFKCLIAENGEIGIHFAHHYKPSAIMLDIGLPGMDGWAVMERLKDNPDTRHIPVHFMSASDKTLKAMKMGAIGFLSKPVKTADLEKAFKKIEDTISKRVKNLLVVEDDDNQRKSILELIGNGDVRAVDVNNGTEAYKKLKTQLFDCMILDLGLEDMSGFELLEKIHKDDAISNLPIIVYTGKDLSRKEEDNLRKYTESIIIKGAKSPERLLDETTLFLHRVEASLPDEKKKMLRLVHNKEAVLRDKKILLIDDDMRNLFAISSILEECNMKTIVAKNGNEGIRKLEEIPDIDLVLMDIMMPEMDGYEATRKIRQQKNFKNIPVIALTAKAMKGDRNKCIEAGANDYLSKPIEAEKLLSLLRVWLYK